MDMDALKPRRVVSLVSLDTAGSPPTDDSTRKDEPVTIPFSTDKGILQVEQHFHDQPPRKPLSAYSIFFRDHRMKILNPQGKRRSQGKLGFSHLASQIAHKWRTTTPAVRAFYEDRARHDRKRYESETDLWKATERVLGPVDQVKGKKHNVKISGQNTTTTSPLKAPAPRLALMDNSHLQPNDEGDDGLMPLTPEFERYYHERIMKFKRNERRRLIMAEKRRNALKFRPVLKK